ncbi:MAG TPA: hypothetical protein PK854_06655 [Oscillospiraceae bacterium]|nr:hypothetical protein [Oscillospiraceae bacterium]HPS34927.1 hypothetical protein [Oscillospiraceae bacterium]
MLKKTICAVLVLIVSASALIGCKPSEKSTPNSSEASSSAVSTVSGTSSATEDKVLAPMINSNEITGKPTAASAASVFTVDTALREKYFDILSRFHSATLPLIDFESPAKLRANELISYAVGVTTPLSHPQTSAASMYLFDFHEIQYSLQKNLGVQINFTSDITGFIYNSGNNILYVDFVLPSYSYYYRLESLSADASGKYTAVFNVYRDIFTTEDAYNSTLKTIRSAVTGNTVTTDLKNSAEITLTFNEMVETDGTIYLLLLSKSTVKK